MKAGVKIAIVVLLAAAVAATFALRGRKRAEGVAASAPAVSAATQAAGAAEPAGRPRIIELGSVRCRACQEMAVVLDQLRASQGPKLQVDFIDVFEHPGAGDPYKISLIPTQILYDAAGMEIFRHTGYFSHDDILAKFREHGVKL